MYINNNANIDQLFCLRSTVILQIGLFLTHIFTPVCGIFAHNFFFKMENHFWPNKHRSYKCRVSEFNFFFPKYLWQRHVGLWTIRLDVYANWFFVTPERLIYFPLPLLNPNKQGGEIFNRRGYKFQLSTHSGRAFLERIGKRKIASDVLM